METGLAKIMIVDDEPRMCDVLRRILERSGYETITAFDGETAIKLIKKNRPDVMLLDLMMPGMNGREVCRQAREISPATRIIYFTGKSQIDAAEKKELRREVDAFLTKPASTTQILSKINSALAIQ